jgi:hypothetical protein
MTISGYWMLKVASMSRFGNGFVHMNGGLFVFAGFDVTGNKLIQLQF